MINKSKASLQLELLSIKKRIKLLMNFRNYGDVLGKSKEDDKRDLADLVIKQKEIVSKIKKKGAVEE
jgi:hypothetical protein